MSNYIDKDFIYLECVVHLFGRSELQLRTPMSMLERSTKPGGHTLSPFQAILHLEMNHPFRAHLDRLVSQWNLRFGEQQQSPT